MFCPSCGAQMPDNAKFCQKCGSQLGRPASPGQQNPQPQQPNTYINRSAPQQAPNTAYTNGPAPGQIPLQTPKTAYTNGPAPQQAPNAAYTNRPASGQAPLQTPKTANTNRPSQPRTAGSAAAKAGKAGMGLGTKIVIGAAVGGVALAAAGGLFDDGGGGEGGGTYKPPVTEPQDYNGYNNTGGYSSGGNSSGGYSGGGDVSYNPGQAGEYFIWESATPDSGGIDAILVRVSTEGSSTVMYYVYDDGTEEEMFTMNGTTSSGNLSLSISEEEGTGSIDLSRNSDGSFSGRMTTNTDEGHARSFTKLIPVTPAGGGNWVVQTTGETLTYDQIDYDELDDTEIGKQFLRESASAGNTFVEYDNNSSNTPTFNPVPATPKPSSGNNAVTIPDDVMQVYVTYEVENIEHEYNGVPVPNHIHMPNETEQKRFESLIAQELHGDRLDFWLANKDKW